MHFNLVTKLSGALKKVDVSFATQRAFQSEGFPAAKTFINLREQLARGANGTSAGFQRRKTARDFIRV